MKTNLAPSVVIAVVILGIVDLRIETVCAC